jgi:hypothetical protein
MLTPAMLINSSDPNEFVPDDYGQVETLATP